MQVDINKMNQKIRKIDFCQYDISATIKRVELRAKLNLTLSLDLIYNSICYCLSMAIFTKRGSRLKLFSTQFIHNLQTSLHKQLGPIP